MNIYNVRYVYLALLLTYSMNLSSMEVGQIFTNIQFVIPAEIVNLIFLFSLDDQEVKELEWGQEVNYRAPYTNLLLVCKKWKEFIADSNALLGKVLRSEVAEYFSTYIMKQNFNGYICNRKLIPKLTELLMQNCIQDLNPLSIVEYQHFLPQSPKLIQQGVGASKTLYPPKKEKREISIIFIAASIGCLQYFQELQKKNPQFFSELNDELKEKLKKAAQSYTEIVALLNSSSEHVET